MASMAQLHYCSLTRHYHDIPHNRAYNFPSDTSNVFYARSPFHSQNYSLFLPKLPKPNLPRKSELFSAGGGGGDAIGGGGGGGGGGEGGGGGGDHGGWSADGNSDSPTFGILGLFINGWRSRVAADPQFPFKVLMEELVGVSACVLGDMASRPNFGLNELDFVFSTLVVGSILNFTLMYLLAPTAAASSPNLPAIFRNCPTSHMFEPGAFSLFNRLGTFMYKGAVFAAVGFAAGLVGTALSNGLMKMRKKMDPNFETPNKPPPTILNAMTWATHMGISSNFRYQTLNGIEFFLDQGLPPLAFKTSVVVLRCLNNVLGGMSFVILARLTGSQNVEQPKPVSVAMEEESVEEKEKLLVADGAQPSPCNQSSSCK